MVIYHHLSQYYLKKIIIYFFLGLGTFSKKTKLKKIYDLNYRWMEIFSIFWLKDMKSALKNKLKDTDWKSRDWNQGRSDFKPLWCKFTKGSPVSTPSSDSHYFLTNFAFFSIIEQGIVIMLDFNWQGLESRNTKENIKNHFANIFNKITNFLPTFAIT